MPKVELIGKEYKDEIEGIREKIKERALRSIRDIMPSKVIEINNLLQTPKWNISRLEIQNYAKFPMQSGTDVDNANCEDDCMQTTAKKKKISSNVNTPNINEYCNIKFDSNEMVTNVIEVMKSQMLDVLDIVATIKTWIQLNIPQIEDGNNFGVSVQEETLGELTRIEESVYNNLQLSTKYYLHRAKYLAKILKYPGIADYKQAIREIDEKEYTNTVILMNDLKNNYAILHDLITKNWHKISNPRSQNVSSSLF